MILETRELFRKYTNDETFEKIKEMDTLVEMLEECNKNYANEFAITDASGSYTFAQLYDDVAQFRGVLKDNNVAVGSTVGIIGANSYALVKAFLAITTYGCTALILPMQLDDKTIFGCSMKGIASATRWCASAR